MSMHEIEAITEESIILLDKYYPHQDRLRSLIWNLYEYESCYDTGYTKLRLIKTLIKHKYMYTLNLVQHPHYAKYKQQLDNLSAKDCWLYRHPDKEWDGENNPVIAYYNVEDKIFYYEAGSELWQQQVEQGQLRSTDANHPEKIPIKEIVLEIFKLAEQQQQIDIMREWYSVAPIHFLFYEPDDLNEYSITEDPVIKQIKAIADHHNLLSMRGEEWDYGMLKFPQPEELADLDNKDKLFLSEWFELKI